MESFGFEFGLEAGLFLIKLDFFAGFSKIFFIIFLLFQYILLKSNWSSNSPLEFSLQKITYSLFDDTINMFTITRMSLNCVFST